MYSKPIKDKNIVISQMKGLAIFSVASAHSANGGGSSLIGSSSEFILRIMGIYGVILFFILSGYLFANNDRTLKNLLEIRLRSIIIPWFFVGSLVYYFSASGGNIKDQLSFEKWIRFIIGIDTYLYFVPVLIVCYLITYKTKYNNYIMLFIIVVSSLSIVCTDNRIITLNPYLNVLNWIGYFCLGIYVNNVKNRELTKILVQQIVKHSKKIMGLCSIVIVSFIAFMFLTNQKVNYWSIYSIVLSFVIILFCYSYIVSSSPCILLDKLGTNSYSIYLLHMPISGIVNIVAYKHVLLITLKPVLVLAITMLLIDAISGISIRIPMGKYIRIMFGLR